MVIAAELVSVSKGKGRRAATRHEMTLRARGAPGASKLPDVVIRNLSSTGLLLETSAKLAVGQALVLDLPETGRTPAKIVWSSAEYFGCVFDRPISQAAVSAAQLRSEPQTSAGGSQPEAAEPSGWDAPTLGQTIKQLRLKRSLSLVEFARKMHVSRPTVWAWEAGKSSPRTGKRQLLQTVLGVTEDELQSSSAAPSFGDPQEKPFVEEDRLKDVIAQAKATVATVAGTTADKVTLIIEI